MVLNLGWAKNLVLWVFEKRIFQFFANFWVSKLKRFFWENEGKRSRQYKSKFGHRSFLENGFKSTLTSNENVLSIWKEHFLVFCKFLSNEVQTIFWESEGKHLTLFKSKLSQSWAQKRVLWVFEKGIFQFFEDFWVTKWRQFSGKLTESVQNCFNQNLVIGTFLENVFQPTMSSKTSVVSAWKKQIFCKFFIKEVETIFWESEAKCSTLFKSKFGRRSFLENGFEATLS